jgi:hypothetical protein
LSSAGNSAAGAYASESTPRGITATFSLGSSLASQGLAVLLADDGDAAESPVLARLEAAYPTHLPVEEPAPWSSRKLHFRLDVQVRCIERCEHGGTAVQVVREPGEYPCADVNHVWIEHGQLLAECAA